MNLNVSMYNATLMQIVEGSEHLRRNVPRASFGYGSEPPVPAAAAAAVTNLRHRLLAHDSIKQVAKAH